MHPYKKKKLNKKKSPIAPKQVQLQRSSGGIIDIADLMRDPTMCVCVCVGWGGHYAIDKSTLWGDEAKSGIMDLPQHPHMRLKRKLK